MKKMPFMIGVALAALTLASCEKELEQVDNSPKAAPATLLAKPDLLTTGGWRQTGLTVSTAVDGAAQLATSDLFAQAKPSMLVKAATYSPDGTYSLMRGSRGGNSVAEPVTGKWQFNAAADTLTVTTCDQTRRLAVTELTATTLRLTYTEEAASGNPSTYTSTFAH